MDSYLSLLTSFGLTDTEARIYLVLNKFGECDVPKMAKELNLSRTAIYDGLNNLLAKNFVQYKKEGKNAYYKVGHPSQLAVLEEQKKRESALLVNQMEEMIRGLTGPYNLTAHKPGVRVYEGKEEVREALFVSLKAKEMIYTFMTIDPVLAFAKELNDEYVAKRKEKNILKKMLVVPTAVARERYKGLPRSATDIRFLPNSFFPFKTNIQIFDDSILFFTITEKEMLGFEIMNPEIAGMFRNMFDFIWGASTPVLNLPQDA